jgi:protein CpxP
MDNLKKKILLSCAAISMAAFTFAASADEHHGNSCKDQANKEECMHAQMDKFRAEHEKKLHDELKITAAQEPAWKAFTDNFNQQMDAMRADHKAMPQRSDMEKLSGPERLQKHLDMMQKRMTMMQNHLAALKTFYAVLTPEQQTTMNKEIARFAHHRHQRWGHHDRHDWHHDGDRHDHANQSAAPAQPAATQ